MALNVSKTGILTSNDFIEKGYQFNTSSGWSYTPAVDTNNSTTGGILIDFSPFQELKQSLKINIELDLTWGDFSGSGTAGTFVFRFQGANLKIGETSTVWEGTNYLCSFIQSKQNPLTLVNNNITGGNYHYSTSGTIPASWFSTYQGSRLAFRVDYRRGSGAVSVSNVKITFDSTSSGPFVASINKEYIAGGQFYEY